jgi:hypothetical protein
MVGVLRMAEADFDEVHRLPLPLLAPRRLGEDDDIKHYQAFEEVYGQVPSERDLPAAGARRAGGRVRGGNSVSSSNVGAVVMCQNCSKQRCVFSAAGLQPEQRTLMKAALADAMYVCGGPLVPEDHELHEVLRTKDGLTCCTDM